MQSGQSFVIDVIGRTFIMYVQKLLVAAFLLDHCVPSFVKRYRSAICIIFSILGVFDLLNNEYISLLLSNFSLERPKQNKCISRLGLFVPTPAAEVPFL